MSDANHDIDQLQPALDTIPDDPGSMTPSLANIRDRIAQLSSAAVTLR